ncbi:hypothetical protein BJY52DRAFT_1262248 [Lactarius psammicola]|nr:hypothetical protein BJY52DRAFT_1262248 [Lactarius psammicola]
MFLTGLARLASSSVVARPPIQFLASQLRERIWHCSASPAHPTLDLHSAYRSLRKALRDTQPVQSLDQEDTRGLLTRTDLHNALDVLAASAKLDDFLLIVDLLDDMMPLFGHLVTADTHRTRKHTALLKWLTTMPTKPGDTPCQRGTRIMRSQGLPPNTATYEFLVRKVFMSSSHHFLWTIRIINHMSRAELPFDDAFLATLLEGFNDLGLPSQAARVFRTNGRVAAVELYRTLRGHGFRPSQATLISLLGDARKSDDITFWERTFEIKAGSQVWSKVIRNALLMRSPITVLEIYRAAKSAGVPINLPLAEPVIRSLCASSLRSPTDAALDLAIEIYQEIEVPPSFGARAPNIGPQVALFQTLLRALSASVNKTKYMPVAIDLLEEMKRRGLSDSAHVTSLVILLMRSASSFAEAFDAYKTVRERTEIPFQAKGYAAILHTFTTLKFDNRTIPPWQDYFQIVKDMEEDGSPVLPHLYTNMFRQMARMATRAKPSDPDYIPNLQKMVHTAREVQHLLSISTTVTLDTPFWNQLMDTYQRAGAFEDAHRIWDKLFHEGRVDAASVSIIFDACGYAGAGRTAVQIFAGLRASGYKLNLRNWHAWLECLCRLGQLDDAARGPHWLRDEVRMRIQRFLPALWEKLPSDIVRGPY